MVEMFEICLSVYAYFQYKARGNMVRVNNCYFILLAKRQTRENVTLCVNYITAKRLFSPQLFVLTHTRFSALLSIFKIARAVRGSGEWRIFSQ